MPEGAGHVLAERERGEGAGGGEGQERSDDEARHDLRGYVGVAPGQRADDPEAERVEGVDVEQDRKSVVSGKSVSVRVDLGRRRISKTQTLIYTSTSCIDVNQYSNLLTMCCYL